MSVKVLITAIGEHLVADVSQVEDTVSDQIVAYWVRNPRIVSYRTQDGEITAGLVTYCTVAADTEFSLSAHHVVAVLDPKEDVLNIYNQVVYGNASNASDSEDGGEADLTD